MDEFEEVFQHFLDNKVIICTSCRYAVVPIHVEGHLRRFHKGITKHVQQRIASSACQIQGVARTPAEVQYPDPRSAPFVRLPIYDGAYACQWTDISAEKCRYACRGQTPAWIQAHCKEVHQWRNWQERGGRADERQMETPNRIWVGGQRCQRFFKAGGWQRYFVVGAGFEETTSADDIDKQRQAETILSQYERTIQEARAQRAVEGDSSRFVPNAWFSFTGWSGHLAQFQSKEQIQAYIQRAADDGADDGLEDACHGTRRLIRAAFRICKPEIVSKAALDSANRRETGAESNARPFYAGQQVKTIRKYCDSWVHILRCIWRTALQRERPKYTITERQSRCLEQLQEAAALEGRDHEEDGPGRSNAQRMKERRQAIEDACGIFWIAMFDHELKDSEFKSGIMSGLAVLGIDTQNGSWKSAMSYTPILSAIVAVMRALVVYRAWQIRQNSIREHIATGWSTEEASDQARSVVDGVDKLVARFMTLRKFGGRISPMDRILRLRTYGLKIRMTTKAGGTVAWEGNNVLVNKIRFGMDDIRTVVHGLYETVRSRLQTELLFVDEVNTLPDFDIKSLADNAAELSEGWNFLHDSRNQFAVDGQRWMWRRMFAEQKIEGRFIVGGLEHVESRDDIQWNQKAVEDYFRGVRRFKEECAVLVHLTAGAPARATELISIQVENGLDGRGQRGVFIENGMVDMVTSYHKGWSASKKSKIIHRYVPREVGELIVYSMSLLEPWVRQLQNMVHNQTDFSPFMWEPKPKKY